MARISSSLNGSSHDSFIFRHMKKVLIFLLSLLSGSMMMAQDTYRNANTGGILFGQGWTSEVGKQYQRFPDRAQALVPSGVWNLSKNTAGMNVRFFTDATTISVNFTLTGGAMAYANMPVTLQSGIDLYVLTPDGKSHWVSPQRVGQYSNTGSVTYADLDVQALTGEAKNEFVLYFPMYNGVQQMRIGVDSNSFFEFVPVPEDDQPIVVYGSSIAQGCSASRPGMAWPTIVGRELNSNVINLGFSGSAMMESGVFDMLAELKNAKLFIIDPIPNIKSNPTAIVSRTLDGVKKLRAVSKAPILLVESLGNSNKVMQPNEENIDAAGNKRLKDAYAEIQDLGIKNVFYLTEEEIGLTEDGMIEGTHPNDIGMREYADAYVAKINWLFEHLDTAESTMSMRMALNQVEPIYERAMTVVANKRKPLITEANDDDPAYNQFSSNAKMPENTSNWGYYRNIIDGNASTYFITVHNTNLATPPNDEHYLQVDLRENPVDAFIFHFVPNTTFPTFSWSDLTITASNDGENWDKITSLNGLPNNKSYDTQCIRMWKEYRYVRFTVNATERALVAGGGPCFCIGDFQMYPVAPATDSPYTTDLIVKTEADQLAELMAQARVKMAENSATAADVNALIEQGDRLLAAIRGDNATEILQEVMKEAKELYKDALAPVADSSLPLLTEANDDDPAHNQFSSNAKMPENTNNWGYYRNIIDGDANTYFITIHNSSLATPPAEKHYLQMDLRENPVDAFIFHFAPYPTFANFSWRDLTVTASNDGEKWDVIQDLNGLTYGAAYDSPCVQMCKVYRYVRFTVNGTDRALVTGGGPCFCIGEFQMYPVKAGATSPYATSADCKAAADDLKAAMMSAQELILSNSALQADVDTLQTKMTVLQEFLK